MNIALIFSCTYSALKELNEERQVELSWSHLPNQEDSLFIFTWLIVFKRMFLKRVITVLEIELPFLLQFYLCDSSYLEERFAGISSTQNYHDIHWEVERLSEEQLSFAKPRHCTLHKTRVLPSAPCPDMASERQSLAARNTNSRSTSHYLPTAKEVL